MRKKPYYTGNYPNSRSYDPNIPIGYWDAMNDYDPEEDNEEEENDCDDPDDNDFAWHPDND